MKRRRVVLFWIPIFILLITAVFIVQVVNNIKNMKIEESLEANKNPYYNRERLRGIYSQQEGMALHAREATVTGPVALKENIEESFEEEYNRKRAYCEFEKVLLNVHSGLWEDGTKTDGMGEGVLGISDCFNRFAIYDIDGDGREELLVSNWIGLKAREVIFDYNPATGILKRQLTFSCQATYYQNNRIQIGLNSMEDNIRGIAVWPYEMYQYDAKEDGYFFYASVESIEREFVEESDFLDFNSVDKDGNGIIYQIKDEHYKVNQVDDKAYKEWYKNIISEDITASIPWQDIKYENIIDYTTAYMDMVTIWYEENGLVDCLDENQVDLGYLFMKANGEIDLMKDKLKSGTLEYTKEEAKVTYEYQCIEGCTMFGIYPGMNQYQAEKQLEEYHIYFDEEHEGYYVEGIHIPGGYLVTLECDGAKVNKIQIQNTMKTSVMKQNIEYQKKKENYDATYD